MAVAGLPYEGVHSLRKQASLRFYDADETHYTGLKASSTINTSIEYTLPASIPVVNGAFLGSSTAGVMSWYSVVPLTRGGTGSDLSAKPRYSLIYVDTGGASNTVAPNINTTPMFMKCVGNGADVLTFAFSQVAFTDLSGSISTSMIANDAITLAKIQNLTNQRVIGRNSSGTGDPEQVSLTQLLDWISGSVAQGDLLVRGGSIWERIPIGTSGYVLTSQGPAANPVWAAAGGGGGGSGLAGWTDYSRTFTTTNATEHTEDFSVAALANSIFEIYISAWKDGGGTYGTSYGLRFVGYCVGRGGAEAALIPGSTVTITPGGGISGGDYFEMTQKDNGLTVGGITVSGPAGAPVIRVGATGIAATTIEWRITFRVMTSAA